MELEFLISDLGNREVDSVSGPSLETLKFPPGEYANENDNQANNCEIESRRFLKASAGIAVGHPQSPIKESNQCRGGEQGAQHNNRDSGQPD
jgi:hypothetical protein